MRLWTRQAFQTRLRDIPWARLVSMLLAVAALVTGSLSWVLATGAAQTDPVVLVSIAVAPGEQITAAQLTLVQVPRFRPAALQGITDPALVIGQYARVQLSPNQLVTPDLVQPMPLSRHVFVNGPLPAELLQATVYELPRTALSTVTAQDQVNILVLVDETRGRDPAFSVGTIDTPGRGARVVRVLRDLNVLSVNERTAFLEVSHTQSVYLWSLQSSGATVVGELTVAGGAPLGPVQLADLSPEALGMVAAP
ncbi:MAG TPA: SAF domain-containing protein [Roseiflexaceae bacterium]|nr:SAF domain-containing protein [Roseiflexaceae bacterium]